MSLKDLNDGVYSSGFTAPSSYQPGTASRRCHQAHSSGLQQLPVRNFVQVPSLDASFLTKWLRPSFDFSQREVGGQLRSALQMSAD